MYGVPLFILNSVLFVASLAPALNMIFMKTSGPVQAAESQTMWAAYKTAND